MRSIIITSFHPLISRNILATPVLAELTLDRELRLVILCPEKKESFFRREFGNQSVAIEPVPVEFIWRDRFLRYLSLSALRTESLEIKRRTEMRGSGRLLALLIAHRIFRKPLRMIDRLLTPRRPFDILLKRYQPAAVFATDLTSELDLRLVHASRDAGIPVVSMVRSWDNPTAKGLLRTLPDMILVHNEVVKGELKRLHGVPAEKIKIVGVPHYDRYFNHSPVDVAGFKKRLGADPNKKLVLYTPVGDRYLSDNTVDRDIVSILDELLPPTCEILVRLPPTDSVRDLSPGRRGRVIVERPGEKLGVLKVTELSVGDDEHLIETLAASDLVITGPSTICIDAAIFNKPVILVGFDGRQKRSYYEGIRRYFDYDHWRPVLQTGGAPLAKSPAEFEELVKDYIADPSLGRDERRLIVERECQFTDGRSSERVVKVLQEFLK